MTGLQVSLVDVYVVRAAAEGLEFLALRRGPAGRCPGSWEAVHGHIEPGETPADAARRELAEETGLVPVRLYNLSRVELFYQHEVDTVALVPVFAAVVSPAGAITLGSEHVAGEWLSPAAACQRYVWPRAARAVNDVVRLLGPAGDAGSVEDVLRIC